METLRLPLLQYTEYPSLSASTTSLNDDGDGITGAAKLNGINGISNLAGLFLFNIAPDDADEGEEVEATATATAAAESPEGGFGNRIRKGEEGEEGEEEQDEEFKWAKVSVSASGAGEIIDGLLQNIEEEGENPGELDTATETDIFQKKDPNSRTQRKSNTQKWNFLQMKLKFKGFNLDFEKMGKVKRDYKWGMGQRVFIAGGGPGGFGSFLTHFD